MCFTAFAKQVTPSSPSFSCLQLAMLFWSFPRAHPCCWVCSSSRCGSAILYSLWSRSFLCCVDHSLWTSGFSASASAILPSSAQVFWLLVSGIVRYGPVHPVCWVCAGACRCCSFTPLCVRHVLLVVLMANCSPTHLLTPSTPSRAARGLLV